MLKLEDGSVKYKMKDQDDEEELKADMGDEQSKEKSSRQMDSRKAS